MVSTPLRARDAQERAVSPPTIPVLVVISESVQAQHALSGDTARSLYMSDGDMASHVALTTADPCPIKVSMERSSSITHLPTYHHKHDSRSHYFPRRVQREGEGFIIMFVASTLILFQISADEYSVFDFWAQWCGPCRAISPAFEGLAANDTSGVKFYKVNVDEQREVSQEAGIKAVGLPVLVD